MIASHERARWWHAPIGIIFWALTLCGATLPCPGQAVPKASSSPPPDGTWTADAVIADAQRFTDGTLGAAQGVVVHEDKVYAYGDVDQANPRVGVIREYDLDLKPTGRV